MPKKTVVSEVASALGAAAALVRTTNPKPSVAQSAAPKRMKAVKDSAVEESVPQEAAMPFAEEVQLVAFLYAERRGFHGGSPEDDWLRAEREVRARRN